MLQSFTGTFDKLGIRSFRIEPESSTPVDKLDSAARFWAVVDSQELPLICQVMKTGDRIGALRLISLRSHSMGTILPD